MQVGTKSNTTQAVFIKEMIDLEIYVGIGDEHMKKPKIVFVTRRMMMGGIEKALISMLEQVPKEKYDITVLLVHTGGELFGEIPDHVKVQYIFDNENRIIKTLWKCIIRGRFVTSFNVILNAVLLRRRGNTEFDEFIYYSKTKPFESTQYDLAISYSGPLSLPVIFVAKNIKAKRKILWIHSDVSGLNVKEHDVPVKKLRKYFRLYDNIICVSQYAVTKFNKVFPNLPTRITAFSNILDKKRIEERSIENKGFSDIFEGVRILTVGRISKEKGQDIIPKVLSKLLAKGYNVRWYCIGEGPILEELRNMIEEYHLENNLILLGMKQNPLPYVKDCDFYVQPSRRESYCITVAEARVFNKPIVITDTGASEQILHEKTGLIVEFGVQQVYKAIKRLMDDQPLKSTFIKNLSADNADTTQEMEKFYEIVDGIS